MPEDDNTIRIWAMADGRPIPYGPVVGYLATEVYPDAVTGRQEPVYDLLTRVDVDAREVSQSQDQTPDKTIIKFFSYGRNAHHFEAEVSSNASREVRLGFIATACAQELGTEAGLTIALHDE